MEVLNKFRSELMRLEDEELQREQEDMEDFAEIIQDWKVQYDTVSAMFLANLISARKASTVPSVSLDTQIEDHTSESTYLESSLEVDEPQPHTATVVEDIIVSVNGDLELLNNECSITEDTLLPILHYDSVDVQVTTSELVVASNNNFQQYGVCYMPVTHGVCYNSYPLATTITTLCDMRLSDSTIFHAVVAYLTGTHSCVRRVFDPGGYLIQ